MTVTADQVWAEDALRFYGTSLYPAALRITRNALDAEDHAVSAQLLCARSPGGSAEDQVIGRLLDPEMITVLRELPDRYRIVVYLADLEGLGYRQISALTGMPLGSVKSCLHRARCRLRAELSAYAPRDQRASLTSCAGCALACQVSGEP